MTSEKRETLLIVYFAKTFVFSISPIVYQTQRQLHSGQPISWLVTSEKREAFSIVIFFSFFA